MQGALIEADRCRGDQAGEPSASATYQFAAAKCTIANLLSTDHPVVAACSITVPVIRPTLPQFLSKAQYSREYTSVVSD